MVEKAKSRRGFEGEEAGEWGALPCEGRIPGVAGRELPRHTNQESTPPQPGKQRFLGSGTAGNARARGRG
ncbi:MAG: hypothetical protein LBP71_06845, partial [Spirochaetaceae bacterium]|nr:hypothetical protein [Spirochaetaceae bacterium]